MSKRAVHLYPWDGGTEADSDMPDHVYCGTEGDLTDDQLANDWRYVTCKRCLKLHEREKAWQAAEDRDQKVKLFDEAQAITMDLGHMNISTAIKTLIAENERLKGLQPSLPPRPPEGDGLPRFGLRWNGPSNPLAVSMEDGYWTPWHLADQLKAENEALHRQVKVLQSDANSWQSGYNEGRRMAGKDAKRYRWLRENHILAHVQVTQRDGSEPYVYAEELDRSIDEILDAMSKEVADAGSTKG